MLLFNCIGYNTSMNVYDFDKTIYPQDSSVEFYLYNLKRKPSISIYWLSMAIAALKYKLKLIPKTEMKIVFYSYFKMIDVEKNAKEFWESRFSKINDFYLKQKDESDVIISASPEVLLNPICDQLGVKLIASRVDAKTGFSQENCYGAEKVKRFREQYPDANIESFYSDSLSDSPLADISEKAYLVLGQEIKDWPKK